MAWELPSSIRKTFAISISHQVIFKTKTKIIGLTITRTNIKQKRFSMQMITLVRSQKRRYVTISSIYFSEILYNIYFHIL